MSQAPAFPWDALTSVLRKHRLRLVWSDCGTWRDAELEPCALAPPCLEGLDEEAEQSLLRHYRAHADVVVRSDGRGGLEAFRPWRHPW
jgi:hypothetical protein